MTPEREPPDTETPTETEAHEAQIKRLRDSGAVAWLIGEAAMNCLEHLLKIEHLQLAAMHAAKHEAFWDDGRKLDVLERLQESDMEAQAVTLCHRWRLSELCREVKPGLYRKLFLWIPRTIKGETT